MSNLKDKFGKRLKELREDNDLTQEELSFRTNLSVEFISALERGVYAPSFETIEKLTQALNTTPKDLFTFKQED